jgi:hypothetical protein
MDADDSIANALPYYRFVQVYDSVSIVCLLGEYSVSTTDGRYFPFPQDFDPENHTPLCTSSLSDLNTRQLYAFEPAGAGDTVRYFMDLYIHPVYGTETVHLSIADTVLFITQLYDSSSGNCIAELDTLGVIPVDDYDSLHTRIVGWKDTMITRTHVLPMRDYNYSTVTLKMKCVFHGPENDVLCREDVISPVLYSVESAELRLSRWNILRGM